MKQFAMQKESLTAHLGELDQEIVRLESELKSKKTECEEEENEIMEDYKKYGGETVQCTLEDGEVQLFNARFTSTLLQTEKDLFECKQELSKMKHKYKLLKTENEQLKQTSTK